MANNDVRASGIGSMSASAPGVYASVDITLTSLGANDRVTLAIEYVADRTQTPSGDSFDVYFVKGTNKITVYANRPQTPAVKIHAVAHEHT